MDRGYRPPTRRASGRLLGGFLVWYRDTKRDYVRWAVEMTQRHTGRLPLIYAPGLHITEGMWEEAVATGRGNVWVTIMNDTESLIDLAAERGAWIQYTGFGPGSDGLYVSEYVREHGYDLGMWAENPGVPGAVRKPLELCRAAADLGYFGFDLTFSGFLLEEDGVTPNELSPAMKGGRPHQGAGARRGR